MAWTVPKTWSSEPLTSTDMNTYIRDNQNYLKQHIELDSAYMTKLLSYSTTATSWVNVDATNLRDTITTTGGDVLATLFAYGRHNTGNPWDVRVTIDGDNVGHFMRFENAGDYFGVSFAYVFRGVSAGSHTFSLQYQMPSGGTGWMYRPQFTVRELL